MTDLEAANPRGVTEPDGFAARIPERNAIIHDSFSSFLQRREVPECVEPRLYSLSACLPPPLLAKQGERGPI
ncbi:MAG TPA: hypothetical protein VGQ65_22610 [Thermoanaerobaculia bacterium]|nr:hypothetical protein [Thermoanaerobaculia bacterium]